MKICPASGYGQTDDAPADMRVVAFDHIATGRPRAT